MTPQGSQGEAGMPGPKGSKVSSCLIEAILSLDFAGDADLKFLYVFSFLIYFAETMR